MFHAIADLGQFDADLERSWRLLALVSLYFWIWHRECDTSLRCLSLVGYFFRSDLRSQQRLDFTVFYTHQLLLDQMLLQQDFLSMTSQLLYCHQSTVLGLTEVQSASYHVASHSALLHSSVRVQFICHISYIDGKTRSCTIEGIHTNSQLFGVKIDTKLNEVLSTQSNLKPFRNLQFISFQLALCLVVRA